MSLSLSLYSPSSSADSEIQSSESTGRAAVDTRPFPFPLINSDFNNKKNIIKSSPLLSTFGRASNMNYNSNGGTPQYIYPAYSPTTNIDQAKYDKVPSTGMYTEIFLFLSFFTYSFSYIYIVV